MNGIHLGFDEPMVEAGPAIAASDQSEMVLALALMEFFDPEPRPLRDQVRDAVTSDLARATIACAASRVDGGGVNDQALRGPRNVLMLLNGFLRPQRLLDVSMRRQVAGSSAQI